MDLNLLFNLANLYVLPFWALMIILPKWNLTNKIMTSYLPFIPLAGLYIFLFFNGLDIALVGNAHPTGLMLLKTKF